MKIFIRMKAAGKRRPVLEHTAYEIPDRPWTLETFLTEIVRQEVERYNNKEAEAPTISFLTEKQLEDQAYVGKVHFGSIYSDKKADQKEAIANALQCFKDGLVRVFQNEEERENLEEPLKIAEGDCFTFMRLTFLAGRLW